ncbi:MAG: permease-like cell division protein FtsX [Bacteroidetes bacterium]|nr:permease-like cell division protein FtsX [Bacteroidota bacterium]MDA0950259.1 permease-like cell division protein FtsX [Bacteroidota bacterium]
MSSYIERYERRRLRSSYVSVTFSISMVLLLLGSLFLLLFNAQRLGDYFKEQLVLTAYIRPEAKEVEIEQLVKSLAVSSYIKESTFVSKEDAATEYTEEIDQDFVSFLGFNPLRDGVEVRIKAEYITSNFANEMTADLLNKAFIEEVIYDVELLELLESNFKVIRSALMAASAFLLLISLLLINSSIRLSIYSKRLVLKTMRLVGAKKSFIRRPFIRIYVGLGLIGATLASLLLLLLTWQLNQTYLALDLWNQLLPLVVIIASLYLIALLITLVSAYLSTMRFLSLKATSNFA